MSHTFEWEDDRSSKEICDVFAPDDDQRVYIHHNGDYSGDATIVMPSEMARQVLNSFRTTPPYDGTNQGRTEIKLPARMLADFARQATVREAIGALEDML